MNNIYRGNLYYADLNPVIGSEQGGTRPVLVVQNNRGNRYSNTILVSPTTTKVATKMNLPTHVFVKARDNLRYDSIILTEQTRVIDKSRLTDFIGKLTRDEMLEVDKALIDAFGVNVREYFEKLHKENK